MQGPRFLPKGRDGKVSALSTHTLLSMSNPCHFFSTDLSGGRCRRCGKRLVLFSWNKNKQIQRAPELSPPNTYFNCQWLLQSLHQRQTGNLCQESHCAQWLQMQPRLASFPPSSSNLKLHYHTTSMQLISNLSAQPTSKPVVRAFLGGRSLEHLFWSLELTKKWTDKTCGSILTPQSTCTSAASAAQASPPWTRPGHGQSN